MFTQIESPTVTLDVAERERVFSEFFEGLGRDAVHNAMNSGKEWKLRQQTPRQAKMGVFVIGLSYEGQPTQIAMEMREHWDPDAPRMSVLIGEEVVGRGTIGFVMPQVEKHLKGA